MANSPEVIPTSDLETDDDDEFYELRAVDPSTLNFGNERLSGRDGTEHNSAPSTATNAPPDIQNSNVLVSTPSIASENDSESNEELSTSDIDVDLPPPETPSSDEDDLGAESNNGSSDDDDDDTCEERPITNYNGDTEHPDDFEMGWEWTEVDPGPSTSPFLGNPALLLHPSDQTPMEYFKLFLPEFIFDLMAEETNRYAHQKIASE